MRPENLQTWVRANPFVPFRIKLASGRTFEIRHPEMMKVGRSIAHVYSSVSADSEFFERTEMISLLLIESVEPLELSRPV
jgi:hypothetical protein